MLAAFTLLFALDLAEEFLYQSGFFVNFPHLLQILAPIDLLYGPFLLFYVQRLTLARHRIAWWQFAPALFGAILLAPFYFSLSGAEKLATVAALRTGDSTALSSSTMLPSIGAGLFGSLTVLQIGGYLYVSIRRIRHHQQSIQQSFSATEKISLNWLSRLLVGLSLIYVLFLADQIFPDFLGVNLLGDSITVLAVVLIYAMGYLGLNQPAIFAKPVSEGENQRTPEPSTDRKRYQRSGLDSEASRSFVEALDQHMQREKPYLQGGLTLPELAQQLDISTNYVSQIINEQYGLNFHDYINGYRVEEAKTLIAATKHTGNILQIVYECGFNSKSAFYSAFKKFTGMTPSRYKKSIRA